VALTDRLLPYRRLAAAAGVGLAVAGAVGGTYVLVQSGLGVPYRDVDRGVPAVAADGPPSEPQDDPAVTVLQPTPSRSPSPTPVPHRSVTPKPRSASVSPPQPSPTRSDSPPTLSSPSAPEPSPPRPPAPSASEISP
jgi:hypothetical protein